MEIPAQAGENMLKQTAWNNYKNILCVRLDALGDVLMTTPAFRALKESVPGRRLSLLTSPSGAEVAELIPEIDEVLVFDSPWVKSTARSASPAKCSDLIAHLSSRNFDA